MPMLALAVAATILVAASSLMFISTHDLHLVLVVLGFALVMGGLFAGGVVRSLTDDLERIAETARVVGSGDLTARTGIERPDEIGALAHTLDVMTERLDQIEAQRRKDHEARQAFLTAIGHDLRTPMAALRAAIEALQDGISPDPDRYLRSMQHDVEALAALVDDLFLLAKIESGRFDLQMMTIDVTEVADEAIEAMRPFARQHGVDLVLEAGGHVPVVGGPEALSRVIRNLVDNAIQHSPRQGTVVVRVDNEDPVVVWVVDEGPGFPPDFVGKAFESFTRHDEARARSTGGAGLGLAIAHRFIQAHGGSIWAEDGPGGRVGFRLPALHQSRSHN
jgi:two-component system sensor histidine kinase BaeS